VNSVQQAHIILFDGVCNLCSASVQFVLKRDSKELFQFCTLQSAIGKRLLEQYGLQHYGLHHNDLQNHGLQNHRLQSTDLKSTGSSSMILLARQKALTKSSAALTIARYLDWPWPLLYGFIVVPKFLPMQYTILSASDVISGLANGTRVGLRRIHIKTVF
jgi:predicted DCC family thiol-disulfide oxidoreductase YuxK